MTYDSMPCNCIVYFSDVVYREPDLAAFLVRISPAQDRVFVDECNVVEVYFLHDAHMHSSVQQHARLIGGKAVQDLLVENVRLQIK